ncbi:nucleotide exchange factor GrpE [Haloplanus salinus]|jgi:molecular chaperone GrpE|uniref:Protein GrpE n=1 Tax=Haloplanus salinus TaxID=1126245 RepID=A0A368NFF1_9EURY|nr:nucleotide exchange factor GrpE [Haloplanus salinus]
MHEDAAEETADAPEDDPGTGAAEGNEVTDLADRVAEHDAELGAAVENLEERTAELEADLSDAEARVDDLESKLKRTQADFQNYKKRAKKRQEEIKERATEDFLARLVPVRDDLVRALDQDEGVDIRDGVESTLSSFDRVLEEEGVTPIEPVAGDEVDPTRHQVMMRVESDRPEGTVVDRYRPGYEMAGSIIQEAQVTVSDGGSE